VAFSVHSESLWISVKIEVIDSDLVITFDCKLNRSVKIRQIKQLLLQTATEVLSGHGITYEYSTEELEISK
jgi:hypothetical protein